MAKMNVEVKIQRSRGRGFVAQACVRAKRGERYARHAATGARCGNGDARKTPKKAIASALQALGRKMMRKAR